MENIWLWANLTKGGIKIKSGLQIRLKSEEWEFLTNTDICSLYSAPRKETYISHLQSEYGAENVRIEQAYDSLCKPINDFYWRAIYIKKPRNMSKDTIIYN